MNPWTLVKLATHSVIFMCALPFLVMALILQCFWLVFSGVMSLITSILSFGISLVVLAALVVGPIMFFHYQKSENSRSRRESSARAIVRVDHGQIPSRQDFALVGPDGRTIALSGPMQKLTQKLRIAMPQEAKRILGEVMEHDFECIDEDCEVASEHAQEASRVLVVRAPDAPQPPAVETVPDVTIMQAPATIEESVAKTDYDEDRPIPAWVDEFMSDQIAQGRIRVETGPFESREACEVSFRDAVDQAIQDYVRTRAEICLNDLHMSRMPWHEVTIQRIAQNLRLSPTDEYIKRHAMPVAGEEVVTWYKYGLVEIPPRVRDHVDGELTRWSRSFQAAGVWGGLLAGLAAVYLFLRVDVWGRVNRLFTRTRTLQQTEVT